MSETKTEQKEEELFKCDVDGCDWETMSKGWLTRHKKKEHGEGDEEEQDKSESKQQIVEIREEVKDIMSDKKVFNSLAKTTFKGLEKNNIPQAIMEGMMKGFKPEDFFKQNVYAIPFNKGKDYALATSIDYMRKIAMRSGQIGKSEPEFIERENKNTPEACKVTVWKKGGHEKGYTATVYFDEYNTNRNLWKNKPRTMIAKVAEMHALRMAFPEELQNHYIAEEQEKDPVVVGAEDVEVVDSGDEDWREEVDEIDSVDELQDYYKENSGKGEKFDNYVGRRMKELKEEENENS